MRESPPKVITIPAKPEVASRQAVQRQLRVAAYCRVSTDDEEQLTSYEAQQNYYTDKIMTNREWTMAGIFADEGPDQIHLPLRQKYGGLPELHPCPAGIGHCGHLRKREHQHAGSRQRDSHHHARRLRPGGKREHQRQCPLG